MAAAILLSGRSSEETLVFRTVDGIIVKAQAITPAQSAPTEIEYGVRHGMKLLIPSVPVNESLNSDHVLRARVAAALNFKWEEILFVAGTH